SATEAIHTSMYLNPPIRMSAPPSRPVRIEPSFITRTVGVQVVRGTTRISVLWPTTRRLEAESLQRRRIALPVLQHLHAQEQKALAPEQRLEFPARLPSDLLQHRAALADHDPLLRFALHQHVARDRGHPRPRIAFQLLEPDRDRMRPLLPGQRQHLL